MPNFGSQVIRLGRAHVPQFIASGSIQPQGAVAWEQRLRDPGSAPVPGENVQYVVAMNGRVKVSVAFSKATQTQPSSDKPPLARCPRRR
jgi:hypothetical protein